MILTGQHDAVLLTFRMLQACLAASTPINATETDCQKTEDGVRKMKDTSTARRWNHSPHAQYAF